MAARQDGAMPGSSPGDGLSGDDGFFDPCPMTASAEDTVASAPPGTFFGFGAMCLGMFMAIVDVQIVATSLPTIQEDLGMAQDQASWIQTAYLIAEIVSIPLTGILTRLFGLRRLFALSVLVFTLASCGCAASGGFAELIGWRVLQGFSGGTLIPSVFSAVFLLFPHRQQGITTTIAGVLAVLAPTVGPIVGGYITGTYSWHWLFLINVAPGMLAIVGGLVFLPRRVASEGGGVAFDALALFLLASGLAALEIALKDGPHLGWWSLEVSSLLAWALFATFLLVRRAVQAEHPLVDFTLLTNRNFAIGSSLSFVLGIGLFGSVYLMPIFLAYVRGHGALAIGEIMLATGIAQLISAPIAVALERRVDPRLLTAFGFTLFALGIGMSAVQTGATDAAEMFWPQAVRGFAIMFCLLPPTRLALGRLPPESIPDASALFNLMRNLGGAIGLALIDTIIYGEAEARGAVIAAKLKAGDAATAAMLGVPAFLGGNGPIQIGDQALQSYLGPKITRQAFVETTNLAWGVIAALTLAALLPLLLAKGEEKRP